MDPAVLNRKTFDRMIRYISRFKAMNPESVDYLSGVMTAGLCKRKFKFPHHAQGEHVETAYYIGRGYIVTYAEVRASVHVVGIYGEDEIVGGFSFVTGQPSPYNIRIVKDTYVLAISKSDLEKGCRMVKGLEEQVRLTLGGFEARKVERLVTKSLPVEEAVLKFYGKHPGLLHSGLVPLEEIASFLGMGRTTLAEAKGRLIEKGLLPGK